MNEADNIHKEILQQCNVEFLNITYKPLYPDEYDRGLTRQIGSSPFKEIQQGLLLRFYAVSQCLIREFRERCDELRGDKVDE